MIIINDKEKGYTILVCDKRQSVRKKMITQ